MANVRLLWNNLLSVSGVVVTKASEVSTLPATNAVIPDRTLVWRSLATAPLATPGAPAVAPQGTTGATAYGYKVVARTGGGTTPAGAQGSTATGNATLTGVNFNRLTWSAVTGALTYAVYRTVGGATQGLIGTTAALTFDDTGLAGDGAAAPSTNTSGDQWIAFDTLSAQAVTGVALANVKLHGTSGTVKLQSSADGSTWADVATLPAADTDTRVTFAFFGSLTFRYWRLYFTNVPATADYVEVGYPAVGAYFEPTFNVTGPLDAPLADASVINKSLSGQRTTTTRPQQSKGRFAWQSMPDADRAVLQQIFRTLGLGTPFFSVLQTTASWTAWLMYFNADIQRTFTIVDQYYDVVFDWEEAV